MILDKMKNFGIMDLQAADENLDDRKVLPVALPGVSPATSLQLCVFVEPASISV